MDFIIETIRNWMPYLLLSVAVIFFVKIYLITTVKRFDVAEVFFSFFRLYNHDEINMSSNKRRVSFMRWNNVLNYYVYFILGLVFLVYLVTRDV